MADHELPEVAARIQWTEQYVITEMPFKLSGVAVICKQCDPVQDINLVQTFKTITFKELFHAIAQHQREIHSTT